MEKISPEEHEDKHEGACAADEEAAFAEALEGGFEGTIEDWRVEVAKKRRLAASTLPAPSGGGDDIPF